MQYNLSLIKSLEKQYGLPLYVFDEIAFLNNYNKFVSCFQKAYSNYQVSYSYKTNYTPYICKLIKDNGGFAEVVSEMEYKIAKKIGYDDSCIIFNGPNKGQAGLDAVLNGSIVNVDNLQELEDVSRLAKSNPDKFLNIGIRVNLDIGQDFISRFGMDEHDIEHAFKTVSNITNLKISGLHCHISRCRNLDAWKKRTEYMLKLSDRFFDAPPRYLDFGSGMFGLMAPSFADQFSDVPSYEEYASVTAKVVADHFSDYEDSEKPILFTEPGTTLINKYIDFIGRIDSIKKVRGKNIAVLNCSEHNLGETCTLKRLPTEIIHSGIISPKKYENMDFTGYTCLEHDVMFTDFNGDLAVGDYVVFGNTGGYSNVLKPPFIKPNCAMVAIKGTGEVKLMKKVETSEDVLQTYIF